MNELIIPPCPNWYESTVMTCTPDNTVIYGTRNDLVFMKDTPANSPVDFHIITKAHSHRILSVAINRNYGQPKKLLVSLAEDKVVKLWNVETFEKLLQHSDHIAHGKPVGVVFAGDDRVVSVTENGLIVIWNILLNETKTVAHLFNMKTSVTSISVCPHATWLAAFGLQNGLVIVADLRKNGKILHKLRGHDKSVVSLAWCPVPVNIFPKNPNNYVGNPHEYENETVSLAYNNNESIKDKTVTKTDLKETPAPSDIDTELEENLNPTKEESESVPKPCDGNTDKEKQVPDEEEILNITKDYTGSTSLDSNNSCDKSPDIEDKDHIINTELKGDSNISKEESSVSASLDSTYSSDKEKLVPDKADLSDNKDLDNSESTPNKEVFPPLYGILDSGISMDFNKEKAQKPLTEDSELGLEKPVNKNIPSSEDCLKLQTNSARKKGNLWNNLTFPDDLDQASNKEEVTQNSGESDFLNQCQLFRKEILNQKDESADLKVADASPNRPKLAIPRRKMLASDYKKANLEKGSEEPVSSSKVEEKDTNYSTTVTFTPPINSESVNVTKKNVIGETSTPYAVTIDLISDEIKESPVEHGNLKVQVESGNEQRTITEVCDMNFTRAGNGRIIVCGPEEEEPRKEFLLASSARENNVYIWRAGTDGRLQTLLTIPSKQKKKSRTNTPNDKVWLTLCWVAPKVLLSSSKFAQLLHWHLPKPKESALEYRVLHQDHKQNLFNIVAPVKYLTKENWTTENCLANVWTVGQDRLLLNAEVKSRRILNYHPTLGGCVTSLTTCPLDPSRLAFGTSDGNINIFALNRPHIKSIITSVISQKIRGKVTALAWHPTQEFMLAFGTIEGRVGYVDLNSKSNQLVILKNFFKNEIYKLEWGPMASDPSEFGIYVVSEGKFIIYTVKKSEQEPTEIELPDHTDAYTFSWKPDYSLLLLSSRTGALLLFNNDLTLSNTTYLQQKLQQITWHPDAVSSDKSVSKYCNYFAAVIKSTECAIFDAEGDFSDNIVCRFGSKKVINAISWCPHEGERIIIGFDEGYANIYNIQSQTVLATYMTTSFDSIICLTWSPVDPNYVLTGLAGNKLHIWNLNKYPALTDEEINERKRKAQKAISKESSDLISKLAPIEAVDHEKAATIHPSNEMPRSHLLPVFYSVKEPVNAVDDIWKLIKFKGEEKSNVEANAGDNNYVDTLQVFGSNREIVNVLQQNESFLKKRGKYNLSLKAALFRGDISAAIKEAIEQKRVDPFILSLCPMVSPKIWQTACETYIQQLQDHNSADALEVATYLLAVHKVEEAISVLCDGQLFKEALALAKARLQDGDPIIEDILNKWSKQLQIHGNFEMAAQCLIANGKFDEAAVVLFRRSDVKLLEISKHLAEKSNNKDLIDAIEYRYNAFKNAETLTSHESGNTEEVVSSTSKQNGSDQPASSASKPIESVQPIISLVSQQIGSDEAAPLASQQIESNVAVQIKSDEAIALAPLQIECDESVGLSSVQMGSDEVTTEISENTELTVCVGNILQKSIGSKENDLENKANDVETEINGHVVQDLPQNSSDHAPSFSVQIEEA